MAKTSVLQRPKVDVNSGRHDFDRSYVSNFNQSHGELRTVFLEPCVAGTKGVINARRFTRSAKVVFPAFQQVDQHIEFFKVPLRYLWSKWNDWKLNINDLNSTGLVPFSTNVGSFGPDLHMNVGCPRLNIGGYATQNLIDRIGLTSGSDMASLYKMMDDMNLAPWVYAMDGVGNAPAACMINLFGLAAYQKVYYDHFRNSTYESNNPYAYNLDWLQDNGGSSAENVLEPSDGTKQAWVTKELFTIRYKNYRNDYFHNLYPSLNYSQSQPTGQDWVLPNNLQGVSNLVDPGSLGLSVGSSLDRYGFTSTPNLSDNIDVVNKSNDPSVPANIGKFGSFIAYHDHPLNGNNTINVQQIRAMFALDKLMRASAYAPKHVKQQFEARYGVKLSDKVSFESERLGSFKNDIVFGEVTATSDTQQTSGGVTTGQQLGAISGKGIGASDFGRDIHFYCEEDSIIIGIQYFLARANYDNLGIDEWYTKLTRNDFFIREYEHLGLRPLYNKVYAATGTAATDNLILGFQEANMRYKVGVDRNHGLFNEYYYDYSNNSFASKQSELSAFTVHSNNSIWVGGQGGVDYRYFKAFPRHLDYIFETNYDSKNMATDQFYGQIRFKFYVNAPMDVHSQPFL